MCLVHSSRVLRYTRGSGAIDHIASVEYPRPNEMTPFNPTAFNVSFDIIRARTTEDSVINKRRRAQTNSYLCIVVTPYDRNVCISQDLAGIGLPMASQCACMSMKPGVTKA